MDAGHGSSAAFRSCATILGLTDDNAIHDHGPSYFGRVHADDRERFIATIGNLTPAENVYSTEYRITRGDGSAATLEETGRADFDAAGKFVRLTGVATDITARKQAEEAARRSTELLQRAQAIAHVGSWELDLIEDRLTWSDEVYRIFGLAPQEITATRAAFLERMHPDDRATVAAAYTRSLQENRDTYEIEHLIVCKNTGAIRVVQERCQHFRDATGKIIRSAGMVHDITERKVAEEKVHAALAEKEVLLREIHHRVKNNLQVVASLINLQSDSVTDGQAQAVFGALSDRVRTMALVHEKLYQTADLARLDFASYAASLLDHLWQAYGANGRVQLNLLIPSVAFPIKRLPVQFNISGLAFPFFEYNRCIFEVGAGLAVPISKVNHFDRVAMQGEPSGSKFPVVEAGLNFDFADARGSGFIDDP